jgi:hypothetical protein
MQAMPVRYQQAGKRHLNQPLHCNKNEEKDKE